MHRIFGVLSCLVVMVAAAVPASADLAKVGPLSPFNGYPYFYEDQSGVRLELCLEPANPTSLCIIDETTTPVFPSNWAIEHFWYFMAADFGADADHLDRALFETAVEATFANEAVIDGDQVSFTRLRIRFRPLVANQDYTFEYPHGSITLTTDALGEINFTSDVGLALGDFSGALNGAVGPNYLTWDTIGQAPPVGPPAGFIGDPGQSHAVIGGVNGFNMVRITGPNIGGIGVDTLETDLFIISGKLATNHGAEANRATYSRKPNGSGRVDVWADSVTNQLINTDIGANAEFSEQGVNGDYFLRHAFETGQLPTHVTVANRSDNPDSVYDPVPIRDVVTIHRAEYMVTTTEGAGVLNVKAESSDKDATTPPTLEVYHFSGEFIGTLTNGVLANHAMTVAPERIVVRSSALGSAGVFVDVVGPSVQGQ